MLVKIYILFIVLYFNLETCNIVSVLGSFGAGGLTIRPPGVRVEVDNIFVAAAIFSSSRNCKVF